MKNLSVKLTMMLALIIGFTSCEKEEKQQSTPEISVQEDIFDVEAIHQETEITDATIFSQAENEQLPTMADLDLKNGNTLHFYGQEEGVKGVLVLEEGDCSGCSALADLASITGKDLNPMEIFWALSAPQTKIPMALHRLFPKQKSNTKSQGWAINLINSTPNTAGKMADLACNNASFQSSIAGGFLGTPEYVRLDKRPNNYSAFKNDCFNPAANGQCWGNPRYKLTAQYSNIRRWKGKVCTRNVEAAYNPHRVYYCGSSCSVDPNCNLPASCSIYQGPQVSFEYYWNGQWRIMKSNGKTALYEIPANKTRVYNWSWFTSSNTSFRLRIRYAKPYDQFDLMMDK